MPTPPHPLKHHVLMLYRRGHLVTVAEGAILAVVTRQTMARWLNEAGISTTVARGRFLIMLRRRAQRIMDGKPPARRPSKAEMRAATEKAIEEFNRRGAGASVAARTSRT